MQRNKYIAIAVAATSAVALGVGGVADAASQHRQHAKRHATKKKHSSASTTSGSRGAETELTGATAQSAKDAALAAVPGGTVWRASTEDPSDASGAAYEVHVTKSDGSEVEVLEDSTFKVIATNASRQHHGDGHGGRGGSETELTGATAQSAKDAALTAVPGGTVWRASKEDPSDASGAAYEVHVTKSDGSEVEVLEDSSFNVIATNASQQGPGGGQHARRG
jgi:uncharacterized membrane protein YkoI